MVRLPVSNSRTGVAQEEPYVKHSNQSDETHPWMSWQWDALAPGVDCLRR